jgi:hypothetical protein
MNVPRLTADLINRVASTSPRHRFEPANYPNIPAPEPDLSWRNTVWGTADGVKKPLHALTDDHLRNIIFYLHRETGYVLKREDYTTFDIIGYNGVWDKRKPIYKLMLMEAEYRNLSWR